MSQKSTKDAANRPMIDRYRLQKILHRSKHKIIYQAVDTRTSRPVVLKTIRLDQGQMDRQQRLQHFHTTMEQIAALDNPHIFPVYDFGKMANEQEQRSDQAYIAMPFASGRSLDIWLSKYQQQQEQVVLLPMEDISRLVRQTSESLQYAHDRDVLHLGIKQSNFLIRYQTDGKGLPALDLTDFSQARFRDLAAYSLAEEEIAYSLAPELLKGSATAASDQYAFAALVFELLTGQSYTPRGHNNGHPSMLFALDEQSSRLTPALQEVLQRALAPAPYERYESMIDFAEAFEAAVRQGEPGEAVHMLLGISQAEALSGISYPLTLADKQRITIAVPPNVRPGQSVQIPKAGRPSQYGGPRGPLIVTFAVRPTPNENQQIIEQLRHLTKDVQALQSQPEEMQQQIREVDRKVTHIFHSYDEDDVSVQGIGDVPQYVKKHVTPGLAIALGTLILTLVLCNCYLLTNLKSAIVSNGNANVEAIATSNAQITATAIAHANVEATASVKAQATVTAQQNRVIENASDALSIPAQYQVTASDSTNLLFNDLINHSNKGQWAAIHPSKDESCDFNQQDVFQQDPLYHAKMNAKQSSPLLCQTSGAAGIVATGPNFVVQTQMSIINGDTGGLVFAVTKQSSYYFYISSTGHYEIGMNDTPFAQGTGESKSINTGVGANVSNLLGIVVKGNAATFYVNLQPIFRIQGIQLDPKGGDIAVIARSDGSPTDVGYQKVKVWGY